MGGRVWAVLLAASAVVLGSCGDGAGPRADATTAAGPWHEAVRARVPAQTADTPAYVSAAAGRPMLATAPMRAAGVDARADTVIARAAQGSSSASTGVVRRAVVGVIRAPGGVDRLVTMRATTDATASGLTVSTLPPDGLGLADDVEIPTTLDTIVSSAFAQSSSGDCVLAWTESQSGNDADDASGAALRIRVATGKWGAFDAPRTLREVRVGDTATTVPALAVAVNTEGQAVVASNSGPKPGIAAWIGSARTGAFAAPLTAEFPELVGPVRAAVTGSGRVVLAWRNSNGDAMDPHGPVLVAAATVAPGSRQISRAQIVDRGPEDYPSTTGIDLVATVDDRATLAFSRGIGEGGDQVGLVADTNRSGRFGRPTTIAPQGSVGGLAVRADGTQLVTLTSQSTESSPATIQTRLRTPGDETFAPAETVGTLPKGGAVVVTQPQFGFAVQPPDAPIPGFDASTGQPFVAWTRASTAGSKHGVLIVMTRDRP